MLERLGGGDSLLAETLQIREIKKNLWNRCWMMCGHFDV